MGKWRGGGAGGEGQGRWKEGGVIGIPLKGVVCEAPKVWGGTLLECGGGAVFLYTNTDGTYSTPLPGL